MSKTVLGFRLFPDQKTKANKIIDKVKNERTLSKSDAFMYVIDAYDTSTLEGNVNAHEYIPPNVMDAMRDIECEYLQFTEDTFYCLEKFAKSKKKDILGVEPREILSMCTACKQGKADVIKTIIEKERRKESMKKLMDFAKSFMVITEKGFLASSYMCVSNILDGRVWFSRDGKTLHCPLNDDDTVDIEKLCMCAINPETNKTPCQYLITLDHLVTISKKDLEEMNLIVPNLDYQEPVVDKEKLNPTPERKIVDSEVEIEMGIPLDICPKCETELSEDDKGQYCHKCDFRVEGVTE